MAHMLIVYCTFLVKILGVCFDVLSDILRNYNYAERQILEDNGCSLF